MRAACYGQLISGAKVEGAAKTAVPTKPKEIVTAVCTALHTQPLAYLPARIRSPLSWSFMPRPSHAPFPMSHLAACSVPRVAACAIGGNYHRGGGHCPSTVFRVFRACKGHRVRFIMRTNTTPALVP